MTSQSTGLQENVASALCYLLWWISGIIFLILEPNNRTVRFHAIQSIIVFGAISILFSIFGWIPFVGWVFSTVLGIIAFILWLVLMFSAYTGGRFKLPVAGDIAEKFAG